MTITVVCDIILTVNKRRHKYIIISMMICQSLKVKKSEVNFVVNKDLRDYAKSKGVFFWQIARFLGFSEPTMTRRLRTELSPEDKQNYIRIIDELASAKKSV